MQNPDPPEHLCRGGRVGDGEVQGGGGYICAVSQQLPTGGYLGGELGCSTSSHQGNSWRSGLDSGEGRKPI